jgi:hypothetical protein
MAVRRKRTGHAGATKDDGTQAVRSVPLDTVFEGPCTLQIEEVDASPLREAHELRCEVRFSAGRERLSITKFEEIVTPSYQADLGPARVTNRTTVRLKSSEVGSVTRDGHVSIPVVLRFDHSVDAPFYEEDSDLPLTLSTKGHGGKPIDAGGQAILSGVGRFQGGALSGRRCAVTYRGQLAHRPW